MSTGERTRRTLWILAVGSVLVVLTDVVFQPRLSAQSSCGLVTFTKSDVPDPVPAGSTLNYGIDFNSNNLNPGLTTLRDTLPGGTTFLSLMVTSLQAWICNTPAVGSGGTVRCSTTNGTGAHNFDLVVTVDASVAPNTTIVNNANLTLANGSVCLTQARTLVTGAVPMLPLAAAVLLAVLLLATGAWIWGRERRAATP